MIDHLDWKHVALFAVAVSGAVCALAFVPSETWGRIDWPTWIGFATMIAALLGLDVTKMVRSRKDVAAMRASKAPPPSGPPTDA